MIQIPVRIQKTFFDVVFKALKYKYYKNERELHGLLCILADHCDSIAWNNYPFEVFTEPKDAILTVITGNGSCALRVQRICIRLLRFILPRYNKLKSDKKSKEEGEESASGDLSSINTINQLFKKIGSLLLVNDNDNKTGVNTEISKNDAKRVNEESKVDLMNPIT